MGIADRIALRARGAAACVGAAVAAAAFAAEPGVHPDGDPTPDVFVTPAGEAVRIGEPPATGTVTRGDPAPFFFTGSDPEGDAPAGVTFTPDGEWILIAHRESRNVTVWDADTRAHVGTIPISGVPQAIATGASTRAVVPCIDDTISIIDFKGFDERDVIPAAENPGYAAVSPAGDLAAVSLTGTNQLAVVDVIPGTIVRTIDGVAFSQSLSFSFEPPATSIQFSTFAFIDNDRVINLDRFGDQIQIINVRTGAVTNLPSAEDPAGFGISADGTTAVIAHAGSAQTISVLDVATETITSTLATPENLNGPIACNADGTVAAAAISNATRVFDLVAGTWGNSQNTASVNQILATPDGEHALCVGFRGSVIDFDLGIRVVDTNNAVSCQFGAMSPTDPVAAMCSTTFGDDLVVVNADGASGSLLAFQLSGPEAEGDRCRTVAVSPDGTTAVGVSIFSDTATIIDAGKRGVDIWAPVGQRPSAVEITPDGTQAVVGNLDSPFASVVDLATATTTNVTISRRAGSVAISPDSRYAYLGVVADGDGVWRIDLDTNTVAGAKITTGNMGGVGYAFSQSSDIELSPDGSVLAIAGSFTNNVSIIDTATWTRLPNVSVGTFPTWLAFSPDGARLFVSNKNDDTVSEIDMTLATPAVVRTHFVGDQPWQIEVAEFSFYVHEFGDRRVRRISRQTGATLETFTAPETIVGMHLDRAGGQLLVTSGTVSTTLGGVDGFSQSQSGILYELNDDTLDIEGTVDLGKGPSASATSSDARTVAAACPIGDGLVIVRDASCPADLTGDGVLNADDLDAFVAFFLGGDLTVDADGNGVLNFDDIDAFVSAFLAGCP